MTNYIFNIAIEQEAKRKSQSRTLHIMAGMLLLVYGIRGFSDLPNTSMLLYTGIPSAIIVLYISIAKKEILLKSKHNSLLRIVEAVFLVMAFIHFRKYNFSFIAYTFLVSAVGLLISLLIEKPLLEGVQIIVSDNGVLRPGKKEIIPWNAIANAMVRNQILTIDKIDNYLMQSKFSNEFTEQEIDAFNAYCAQKIAHAKAL